MKSSLTIVVAIIALLVGIAGGYYYRNYLLTKNRQNFAGQFQRNGNIEGNAGQGAARFGGRPVVGEIISQDDKGITVKESDGSSKIIIFTDSTTYSKTDTASKDDLKVGTQVGVFGTNNSDGSFTAQNVQLNPQFRLVSPTSGQ
jgi:type II secretory pathway pseudopilin PulG